MEVVAPLGTEGFANGFLSLVFVQDVKVLRSKCRGGVGCKMRVHVSASEVCLVVVLLAGAAPAHAWQMTHAGRKLGRQAHQTEGHDAGCRSVLSSDMRTRLRDGVGGREGGRGRATVNVHVGRKGWCRGLGVEDHLVSVKGCK